MPPHIQKSINQAHLEIDTFEEIVTPLERELELEGLEALDELQINTVSQQPTKTNADRPKPTCHRCKKPKHQRNQCRLLIKQREQTEDTQNYPVNRNSGATNSNSNSNVINNNNKNNNHKNSNRADEKPKAVYPTCETSGKTNHTTVKCHFGANAANRPLSCQRRPQGLNQVPERANQSGSSEVSQAAAQNLNKKCHVFTPVLGLIDRRQPIQNFHQLSGSNLRRLIPLIFINFQLLKLILLPTCPNSDRKVM